MQEAPGSGGLRIRLLGELAATHDGAALDLGGPRQRAVLAVLLLARGEVVPAEKLADDVWGGEAPANVTGALQSYVSHLRRRLEPGSAARSRSGVIVREGTGYAVRLPADAVDAWEFEALLQQAGAADAARRVDLLTRALALWHGPALVEYADEPWAEPEIARLSDLRAVAREQLLDARLDRGEAALLVPELEVLVAEEPLREERWRLLVLALYRAQRQADALAALRRARSTLADELGVDPGPALRELEAEVLAQSPSLDVPLQRAPAPAPAPPQAAAAPSDLVDRDRELAVLHRALDDLAHGEPGLVIVEGAAGIGKTRLLGELRRTAVDRGWTVLGARGSQLERSFGFGAVRQLLEPALVAAPDRDALLDGAAASARGVFDLGTEDASEGSFAALHGLYWLTVNLSAAGPLVLALDDLQWCDTASLRFVAYLARRLEGLPVLVVATVRTGERHEDDELLAELSADPSTVVVRPAPLTADGTGAMVRSRLGVDAAPLFVTACHRTTAGNPLLLRQLLRALEADGVKPDAAHADTVMAVGSRAISSMVLVRLRRMPPDATEVARAVAVLGEGPALPAVAALAGLPEHRAADALAALTRAEILRDERPLGFVHPLVRDAVYRDLPPPERELRHERAAQVLRDAGASAEQVAAHVLLAPPRGDAEVVALLRRAARTAGERGAADSAVTCLRRALAEPPAADERLDVLLELGLLETLVNGPASAEHLGEAYDLLDDPATRGEIAMVIARTHIFTSPPGVASRFAGAAAAALPDDLVDAQQGLLALERAAGFMHWLDPSEYRSSPAPEPAGYRHGALMLASVLAWEEVVEGADRERAIALARRALHRDRLWQVDNGLFWVIAAMARTLADDDVGDYWTRARAQAHERGSLFAMLSVNLWAGHWHLLRGDLVEALSCMQACEEQNRMWGAWVGTAYSRAFEVQAHVDLGDLVSARQVADVALASGIPGESGRLLQQAVVRLLLAEGRPADALALLDRPVVAPAVKNPVWNPVRGLRARALHALGRTDEAVPLLDEEVALLRRWGAPSALGAGLRVRGEVTGRADDLREAVALLAPTPAALELARARLALGACPDVPDAEAAPALQAAVEVAHACAAVPVREAAREVLQRRGLTAPACDDVRALSTTDRSILELHAAGRDVAEIAQQLFLTPGTVRALLDSAAVPA